MAGPISVTAAVGAAFGFLRRSWLRAVAPLLLTALSGAMAASAVLGRDFGRAGLFCLAHGLAAIMAQGALFRIAFAERRPDDAGFSLGPGGLQWGEIEWRLLAVAMLRWLLFVLLWSLLLTLLIAVYIGVASAETGPGFEIAAPARWRRALDPAGWLVLSAVALAGLAGLGWIRLRLYLAFPVTVAEARVQLLGTWRLTRGHVWRMLGSLILALLPAVGVILAVGLSVGLLTGINGRGLELRHEVLSLIAGVGHAFVILPLSVGLMSYFHDRLGPKDSGVS